MDDQVDLDQDWDCPLCMEEMDLADQHFRPCPCGYQVCRFCWHRIRENGTGCCPACRREYSEEAAEITPIPPELLAKEKERKRERKERREAAYNSASATVGTSTVLGVSSASAMSRQEILASRKSIAEYRVIQRNLVYVIGVSPRIASESVLKSGEFFGQYGPIIKVVINKRNLNMGTGNSVSAYVTYKSKEDAARAIQGIDGMVCDGRTIRATYGTTKYCSFYLRGLNCPNAGCMYLHEQGDLADSFTKEQLTLGSHHLQAIKGGGQVTEATIAKTKGEESTKHHFRSVSGTAIPATSTATTTPSPVTATITPLTSTAQLSPPSSGFVLNEKTLTTKILELTGGQLPPKIDFTTGFLEALNKLISNLQSRGIVPSPASIADGANMASALSLGKKSPLGASGDAIGSSRASSPPSAVGSSRPSAGSSISVADWSTGNGTAANNNPLFNSLSSIGITSNTTAAVAHPGPVSLTTPSSTALNVPQRMTTPHHTPLLAVPTSSGKKITIKTPDNKPVILQRGGAAAASLSSGYPTRSPSPSSPSSSIPAVGGGHFVPSRNLFEEIVQASTSSPGAGIPNLSMHGSGPVKFTLKSSNSVDKIDKKKK